MHQIFSRLISKFFWELQRLDNECPKFHPIAFNLLIVQRSLIEFSYIFAKANTNFYLTTLTLFARPELIMKGQWHLEIYCLILLLFVFANLVLKLPFRVYTAIWLNLLRSNLVNLLYDLSNGIVGYVSQALLAVFFLLLNIFIQGQLNVSVRGLQVTRNNFLHVFCSIIYLLLMLINRLDTQDKEQILKYTSLVSCLFQILQQVQFSPHKSVKTSVFLASIYLSTLYLGVLDLTGFHSEFTAEILLFPFIMKIMFRQIWIMKQQSNQSYFDSLLYSFNELSPQEIQVAKVPDLVSDRIIYGSILMYKKKHFEAMLFLQQIKCNNLIQLQKKKFVERECLQRIDLIIQQNSNQHSEMSLAVKSLMESENQNFQVYQDVINILRDKINIFQKAIENKTNLFNHMVTYVDKLHRLSLKLEKQYQDYPCDKTQSVLGFLYAEIITDFMKANKLFNVETLSDDQLKRKDMIQDVFSSKMLYLITTYNQGLIIKRASNNANSVLQTSNSQLLNQKIDHFIPLGVRHWHEQLIQDFMTSGVSKFMRKSNDNYFCTQEDPAIYAIDFTLDLSFVDEISFVCFIQLSMAQPLLMVLDQNQVIASVSKILLTNVNVHEHCILNQPVKQIVPSFREDASVLENVEAMFGVEPRSISISSQTTNYIATINVQKRVLNGQIAYYFLFFESLRKRQQLNSSIQKVEEQPNTISQSGLSSARESVEIEIPYDWKEDILFAEQNMREMRKMRDAQDAQEISKRDQQILDVTQKEEKDQSSMMLFSPKQVQEQLIPTKSQQLYFTKVGKAKNSVNQEEHQNSAWRHNREIERIFEDHQHNDAASQVSSLLGMRKSKYFKKFEILAKLDELSSFSRHQRIFLSLFLLTTLLQIVIGLIQLIQINGNLTNLVSDIDLLQIKNLVHQPMESFLVTRWTIVNYNNLRDARIITLERYNEIIQYPRSNLALGYDLLIDNINQVLNRRELQQFLKDTYLDIRLYTNTNIGEPYNLSLRSAINILLNYQHTFKMAYVFDGAAVADSPYVFYAYRNYKQLKDIFVTLNEQILQQTYVRADNMLQQSILIFTIGTFLAIALAVVTYFSLRNNYSQFKRYTELIVSCEKSNFESDIVAHKALLERLTKDQNILFRYQFNLENSEKQLQLLDETSEDVRRARKSAWRSINLNNYQLSAMLVIVILIILGNGLFTFNQTFSYLKRYPQTALFYKQLSDVGTDTPTMYAQREVLYGRGYFPYLNATDLESVMKEVVDAISRTQQFLTVEQSFSNLLLSEAFGQYYESVLNRDLCLHLPESIKERSTSICSIAMSGNMGRGMKTILIYIVNFIQTDMEINKFVSRPNAAANYLELEGAFQLSLIIQQVNQRFNVDLNQQTVNLLLQINVKVGLCQIYNIFVLTFLALFIVALLTVVRKQITLKYFYVQRFLYITPKKTLFFDDIFERNARTLLAEDIVV